jgi:hypothetical protein
VDNSLRPGALFKEPDEAVKLLLQVRVSASVPRHRSSLLPAAHASASRICFIPPPPAASGAHAGQCLPAQAAAPAGSRRLPL